MIANLIEASTPWGGLAVALLVFGFLPGFVLNLIVRAYDREDPRRQELLAELYAVPRWERPFWVLEQFEVAAREELFPFVSWWFNRLVWHRATLRSGLKSHQTYPETFWIPDDEEKAALAPGDFVRLAWKVRGLPGERMWVEILERRGARCVGRLSNQPVFVYRGYGEKVRFHIDSIIDCHEGPPSGCSDTDCDHSTGAAA